MLRPSRAPAALVVPLPRAGDADARERRPGVRSRAGGRPVKPGRIRVFDGLRVATEHIDHMQDALHSSIEELREAVGLGRVLHGVRGPARRATSRIVVGPGLAFDNRRNRMVVDEPQRLDVTFPAGQDRATSAPGTRRSRTVRSRDARRSCGTAPRRAQRHASCARRRARSDCEAGALGGGRRAGVRDRAARAGGGRPVRARA